MPTETDTASVVQPTAPVAPIMAVPIATPIVPPPVAPVPAPQTPAASVAQATDQEPAVDPAWLKERLARHGRSVLKSVGAETEDEAKAAIDKARKAVEAEKGAEQRATESAAALKTEKDRANVLHALVADQATAALSKLAPDHRAAVTKLAGDDPAQQLRVITTLAPTWATQAPPPAPVPAIPPPAEQTMLVRLPDGREARVIALSPAPAAILPPIAPSAPATAPTGTQTIPPTQVSTAPANGGPPAIGAPPATMTERYESLRKSHPAAAGHFVRANAAALDRERASKQQ